MSAFIIEGGHRLQGEIHPQGAKNEALQVICATLLTDGDVRLTNIPDILDVNNLIQLLRDMNVKVTHNGSGDFTFNAANVNLDYLHSQEFLQRCTRLRGSVLLVGPLLARFGRATLSKPGGDKIGRRRLDTHFFGMQKLGAQFRYDNEEGIFEIAADRLHGTYMLLDEASVTGTANIIMAAVLADGETTLENAAREPEVVDLANFLISCGAQIEGHGSSTIRIKGVSSLRGTEYAIMADRIEAGTFLVAAGITGGELLLKNCPFTELESVIAKLESMGLAIEQRPEGVLARYQGVLRGADVKTRPYPGFPTDMQAQIMALMCLAEGSSMVEESIFENRFMHVLELVRMGADIKISGHTAMVRGVSRLTGAPVMACLLYTSPSPRDRPTSRMPSSA